MSTPRTISPVEIRRSDRRLLWTYVTTVAFFILAFSLIYTNQQTIRSGSIRRDTYNWNSCRRQVHNAKKINATNDALIRFLSTVKPQTDATRGVVAIYRKSAMTLAVCGPKP